MAGDNDTNFLCRQHNFWNGLYFFLSKYVKF